MSGAELTLHEVGPRVLAYLAESDRAPGMPADAVIGSGMFDLKLPRFCGELGRIVSYPERGWIAAEPLPNAIAEAHAVLRAPKANRNP